MVPPPPRQFVELEMRGQEEGREGQPQDQQEVPGRTGRADVQDLAIECELARERLDHRRRRERLHEHARERGRQA